MKRKKTNLSSDTVFDVINTIVMAVLVLVVVYPLYFMLVASFSDPNIVNRGALLLYPPSIHLDGYKRIFDYAPIWNGYKNSVIYTGLGTIISLIVTIPAGYALSRKDLEGRGIIMGIFLFTMFFNGGIIPTFLTVRSLGLIDSIGAMVLPSALSVWCLIVTRTYYETSLPLELREASVVDGCGNTQFFLRIALPTSKVIIAVISLMYAVAQWNSFFPAMIYLNSASKAPLQLVLRDLIIANSLTSSSMASDARDILVKTRIAEQLKYGVIIVACIPMLIVYPFLQKYFAKGVMIGAVKG